MNIDYLRHSHPSPTCNRFVWNPKDYTTERNRSQPPPLSPFNRSQISERPLRRHMPKYSITSQTVLEYFPITSKNLLRNILGINFTFNDTFFCFIGPFVALNHEMNRPSFSFNENIKLEFFFRFHPVYVLCFVQFTKKNFCRWWVNTKQWNDSMLIQVVIAYIKAVAFYVRNGWFQWRMWKCFWEGIFFYCWMFKAVYGGIDEFLGF